MNDEDAKDWTIRPSSLIRIVSVPNSLLPDRSDARATRRSLMLGLGATALLGGCTRSMDLAAIELPTLQLDNTATGSVRPKISIDRNVTRGELMYASVTDEGFVVPSIPYEKLDPKHRRQVVVDPTGEKPGTIVVHLQEKHLYLVQPDGDAIRYGVGIGRDGFVWSGRARIEYGKKWPVWTPPAEMIARRPELAKYASGQQGGLDNPLGARALYIFKDGRDTQFRVHGTPEWASIGKAMSSGCVRMINQDVIDLYARVMAEGARRPIVVV